MRYSFFHMDFDTAVKVQLIFHCESVQKRSMILNHNIFNYITEKGFYVAKVFSLSSCFYNSMDLSFHSVHYF